MVMGGNMEVGHGIEIFSTSCLNGLVNEAEASTRLRQHRNIHKEYADPCQRLFNAIGIGSYIRPHRHLLDPKVEDLFAVKGMFALVVFDDAGNPSNVVKFGTERFGDDIAPGVELSPGTWHTVVALTEAAVLLELKGGPFNPNAAKELASWAPEEGTPQALDYMKALQKLIDEWSPRPVTG